MRKKTYIDYVEFLQKAKELEKKITAFNYYDGRLYDFKVKRQKYEFICDREVLTPNKFVKTLGFNGYSSFVNKRFSKIEEYAKKDYYKWWGGYFGGLINVNFDLVNNFVGTGEITTFYDYDINKAYLYALTQFLPTKFVEELSPQDYDKLTELDKIPYFYFFEIDLKSVKGKYFECIGRIKSLYQSFDFLNSKQGKNIVVSEKRLNLINQIYFKDYEIKKIYVFKRERFAFYEKILFEYLQKKEYYGTEFKKNALRLYGTLGQFYKFKPKELHFDSRGDLLCYSERYVNYKCSPQVAMCVADSVAEKLFNIISQNLDKVICWNTDGLTAIQPLNLRVNKRAGNWKLKEIVGLPFLMNDSGKRLFFKDIANNTIYGSDTIFERNGDFYEPTTYSYSNLKKGYCKKTRLVKIDKFLTFDKNKTFRNLFMQDYFIHKILQEEEKF